MCSLGHSDIPKHDQHTHTYTRTHILRIEVANALSNYTTHTYTLNVIYLSSSWHHCYHAHIYTHKAYTINTCLLSTSFQTRVSGSSGLRLSARRLVILCNNHTLMDGLSVLWWTCMNNYNTYFYNRCTHAHIHTQYYIHIPTAFLVRSILWLDATVRLGDRSFSTPFAPTGSWSGPAEMHTWQSTLSIHTCTFWHTHSFTCPPFHSGTGRSM